MSLSFDSAVIDHAELDAAVADALRAQRNDRDRNADAPAAATPPPSSRRAAAPGELIGSKERLQSVERDGPARGPSSRVPLAVVAPSNEANGSAAREGAQASGSKTARAPPRADSLRQSRLEDYVKSVAKREPKQDATATAPIPSAPSPSTKVRTLAPLDPSAPSPSSSLLRRAHSAERSTGGAVALAAASVALAVAQQKLAEKEARRTARRAKKAAEAARGAGAAPAAADGSASSSSAYTPRMYCPPVFPSAPYQPNRAHDRALDDEAKEPLRAALGPDGAAPKRPAALPRATSMLNFAATPFAPVNNAAPAPLSARLPAVPGLAAPGAQGVHVDLALVSQARELQGAPLFLDAARGEVWTLLQYAHAAELAVYDAQALRGRAATALPRRLIPAGETMLGAALDRASHTLFIACQSLGQPAELRMLNASSGALARQKLLPHSDVVCMAVDGVRRLVAVVRPAEVLLYDFDLQLVGQLGEAVGAMSAAEKSQPAAVALRRFGRLTAAVVDESSHSLFVADELLRRVLVIDTASLSLTSSFAAPIRPVAGARTERVRGTRGLQCLQVASLDGARVLLLHDEMLSTPVQMITMQGAFVKHMMERSHALLYGPVADPSGPVLFMHDANANTCAQFALVSSGSAAPQPVAAPPAEAPGAGAPAAAAPRARWSGCVIA